jgi:F-type H+-transporting ATPase subunit delta
MAELTTLAFEVAVVDGGLENWSKMLAVTASVAVNDSVAAVLSSPALAAEQLAQSLIDVCGEELDDKGQNFIHLLAENKRLSLLPEISTLFEVLKANQEKSVDVEITTAFEISSDISSKLETALKTRLQREIRLATRVNQNLIGGAVIRAGDTVIDNSIRGKLSKLAESMNS